MRFLQRDDDLDLARRFPAPAAPFTGDYAGAHRAFLETILDDPELLARFASRKRLPRDFGLGLDERVVEYPWLLARDLRGPMLDAGSTLNHAQLLDRILPVVESLHIVTLAPEPESFIESGVSYVFADLRQLPFRNELYETVVSLSTLEHVGMDNSRYGGSTERAADPAEATARAVRELRRVLAPGGRLLVTVPYGQREDHGWFRQLDAEDVDVLLQEFAGTVNVVDVYAYGARGWQLSSLEEAAAASYRRADDPRPAADRAAAARAVACIEARAA
jgi:SAM-dependent methyltransferase